MINGKVSKRRFTGAGTVNMERFGGFVVAGVDFAWPLAGADEDIVHAIVMFVKVEVVESDRIF